ncbi:BMP family ABC transporter substrate-binding protein [Ponticoccus sp. SC2-23]|uniref:BMP family ABC transporter substrate-binding protein n=1 Tax=Alexandriicola marinus TaxID=2081710 RepID=UPI000FD856B6|nr:BMP family ABC transporter substrate-binding protein [Alexandriicola marinus]MBM1221297.1 BMP family ABC transporter substrate-binding protein [Ponticoccus sp. SC6-9]MBM1225867.1 BMP family ABC transporter substrate-binding protein [Ponticoccus sp. SC6-15]MBM1228019.1 BMP family ABC transporter substrate-binding protein [Ponticoccus sp. SC6-38]MBM1234343.1 BMP family ABC transporter substrate-binding protein [Ponticoccus sp. SC6-45]MBM1238521.1 BMP family ABC transporter substrate-binding p
MLPNFLSRTGLAAAATTLLAVPAVAQDPLTIGFIYPSPVADVGWAAELNNGRLAVEEHFGDQVRTLFVENVPEGPDAARIMNQMAAQGADMIMLGSFGYMNDGLTLAQRNPDMTFIHASGYEVAPNFGNFQSRNYESSYLVGMAAGDVTETDTIGIVAAYAIPEVIGMINAFTLGIQEINPDATVRVVWLNSWFDPPKAQESARALMAQEADVIYSLYQDTPSVVTVAEEEGVWVINTSSDMKEYAPNWLLASQVADWESYFVESVQATLDGTFEGSAFWGGMADGTVDVRSWADAISDETMAKIEEASAALRAGEFHPLTGPIVDQAGTERLADGEVIEDGALLGIDWLVSGVATNLPQ